MSPHFCPSVSRHIAGFRSVLLSVAISLSANAAQAAEVIQLLPLASADIEHFLSGWGSDQCTARVFSKSGQLIGVIQERNSLLVQLPGEVQGVTLEEPRYSKNSASYKLIGQSNFSGGMNSQGELEITTLPRISTVGPVHHFSAMLSMRENRSLKAVSIPVRIEDACGAKSRLAYGPGSNEILRRLLSR